MRVEFDFDFEKAREAVVYLAARSPGGFTKLTASKLLFLADKHHLVRYGRPITGGRYFALPRGPAPTTLLDLLNEIIDERPSSMAEELGEVLDIDRSSTNPTFTAKRPLDRRHLSESDVRALDEILRRHGSDTPGRLINLTHAMHAYKKAWGDRGTKQSVRIPFEDFFEGDSDAVAGVLEEMVEDFELRQAFPAPRAVI